ncbi:MAG TPA: glycosyltransferase family 4 protein [Gammaproteobacteria bacterium]
MRFLFVDLGSAWGGSERYLTWVMEAVRSRGHWAGCVGPHERFAPHCDRLWLTGSRFKHLGRVRRLVAAMARAERADVVHYNADRAIHLAPFVPLPRGVPWSATKHLTQPAPRSPLDLRTRVEVRLTNFSLARAALCICVSASMLSELPPAARRRAVLVENGVADPGPPAGDTARPARAVFLGRVSPEKGIGHLLELAERAGARPPQERCWTLAVAGTGPLTDRVAEAASRLPPGVLDYLGFQADPDAVYARAGALILPSSHEGMPLVILEAFARGLPVVAYDIPGVRDVVADGHNGFLVRPADGVNGLERALDRLFGDEGLRLELGRNARADYERRHGLDAMLARTTELLESLAASSRRA